jgi:DNA mismatch repair protein MutS2
VRAARLLEWPRLRARLEDLASSEPGRALVRALEPTREASKARRALEETSEARYFLRAGKNLPFGGVSDVRSALQRARIGSRLEAADLNRVKRMAESARRLRQVLLDAPIEEFRPASWDIDPDTPSTRPSGKAASTSEGELSLLQARVEVVEPQPALEKRIGDAIDEASEEIKDEASLDLLKARRNIKSTQAAIQTRLRTLLSDANIQPALREAFVTVRDGRYCLPVKAEARGRVPGIVHDRSAGGATIFVEPQSVIDLNNQLREFQAAEREAIDEVLKALTAEVGAVVEALEVALDVCAELDFAFAKGRLSLAHDGVASGIETSPKYLLIQARHPLVEPCVPNDIRLGDEFDVLMITGPNTGGKTVVMKTLGLLLWMTMCGLHIPARAGSSVYLPRAIYADIGDEQSIEQSLSTFSSHMTNIIGIVEEARAGDLAFFDEIGAGTDPDEGAALAKAILRALQRRGVQVLCTTHYGELKHFSASAERFQNASVEFDPQSLSPTYRLRIGVPGASNALDITARLGMSPELVSRARRYLGRDRQEAEAAAQRLEETQRELEAQSQGAERERGLAETLRRDYEKKLARLQAEFDRERDKARREAADLVQKAEREADEALRQLRDAARGGRENRDTEAARGRLRSLRETVVAAQETGRPVRTEVAAPRPRPVAPSAAPTAASLFKRGDIVKLRTLGREGELLEDPAGRERVSVRVGAIKIAVAVSELEATRVPSSESGTLGVLIRKGVKPFDELNLIGKTTDEALPEMSKYLDDALLSGQKEIRIVHGRGSGVLRSFVQKWLRDQKHVSEFGYAPMPEGGDGATVAKLG